MSEGDYPGDSDAAIERPVLRRGQFSILHLLPLLFLFSLIFASVGGLLRGLRGQTNDVPYYYFILFTLLGPSAAIVIVSMYYEYFMLPPRRSEAEED